MMILLCRTSGSETPPCALGALKPSSALQHWLRIWAPVKEMLLLPKPSVPPGWNQESGIAGDTGARQRSLVLLIKKSNSLNLEETLKATCYQLFPSSFNLQQSVIMDEINSQFNSVGCVLRIPFFSISPFPSWKFAAFSSSGAA